MHKYAYIDAVKRLANFSAEQSETSISEAGTRIGVLRRRLRRSAHPALEWGEMGSSAIDPVVEDAMPFAAKITKALAAKNEDMVEFLATFVGMVAQEDGAIAMRCLEAADEWFRSGKEAP